MSALEYNLEHDFLPGHLVRARGREWVVQNGSRRDWLQLRPLSGADEDSIALIPELELSPVEPARFLPPDPARAGNHISALLLRDALRLTLRSGAGPFRSFGQIAVEPRGYQLVPLLMALRLATVRLLIADDVGIGKTIEAGLIARELIDRGEIAHLAVLCPPHLVEQWQSELHARFNLPSIALTATSAARIERELPHGLRLFDVHPIVVVSLDYIKSERHREQFLASAPECIIVDEAHTCARSGAGKQLRFELLKRLADDEHRHLILLTATPHSGDETAFYNLISLLDPRFARLQGGASAASPLRQELARHFVQRRRRDIVQWQADTGDGCGFPRRMKTELTYQLSGEWGAFFDAVQEYCRELAQTIEQQRPAGGPGLVWYATLALLRCVASSPAAAVKALTTRLDGRLPEQMLDTDERLHDGSADDLSGSDLEPQVPVHDSARLQRLIASAQRLSGAADDPKLAALIGHVRLLLKEGFHPVVFCRYMSTAHYVAEHLASVFPEAVVCAVTGELTPEERRARVEEMDAAAQRILIATDCLSEGINLQHLFTAVIHYDLAWNPTRHEQREGRVDRFGQQAGEVRCTLLYGQDNPVDGFVLTVILRKGEAIQKELGVLVPLPEDEARLRQALVKAALMRRDQRSAAPQAAFDFSAIEPELAPLQARWRDALDSTRANRTVFAQRRIRPDEVLPEWHKQQQALGSQADVQRFLHSACAHLGAPLEHTGPHRARFLPRYLPEVLRLRLKDAGIEAPQILDLDGLHRSHPLISLLAQHLLEDALDSEHPKAARCAATLTADVESVTTIYLLRLRHQLSYQVRQREPVQIMAEETVTLAVKGRNAPEWLSDECSHRLLECTPSGNLTQAAIQREVRTALEFIHAHPQPLRGLAQQRAAALKADHQRVREAAQGIGQYRASPCGEVDIIGVYVLLPDSL